MNIPRSRPQPSVPLDQTEPLGGSAADNDQPEPEGTEMSFVDHLEVLRWHVVRAAAAIVLFSTAAFFAKDFLFHDLILAPSREDFWTYRQLCRLGTVLHAEGMCIKKLNFAIQSREMSGQLTMHFSAAFTAGLALGFPYAFWELWRFIAPGLRPQERRNSRGAVFFVGVLFILGLLFGYYVAAPMSINFLSSYQVDESIINQIDIQSYVSTLTTMTLSCAFIFELPIVVFFLAKAGLINAALMREYRRHAIVLILIIAAIITPPDVSAQIIVTLPVLLLYEASIWIAKAVGR